jgi:hypothetical protein
MKISTRQWFATVLAVLAITSGSILLSGVVVVRRQLVQKNFYTAALSRNDVYQRVYNEVLTDPELTAVTEQLLGNLSLEQVAASTARILATNSLHLVLPPASLQLAVERFLSAVLAYVRGDTRRLTDEIDVRGVIENVQETAVEYAGAALVAARPETMATLAQYGAAVRNVESTLSAGRVPDLVPVPSAALPAAGVAAVLSAVAGPKVTQPVATLLDAAVGAGDTRDALIAATKSRVVAAGNAAATALARKLLRGRDFDPVGAVAEHAHTSSAKIASRLDEPRRAVAWFGLPAAIVGLVLMVAGIGALFVMHRARPGLAFALLAVAFILAGVAVNGLWLLARHSIEPPLGAATTTGPGSWNLPNGVRHVLRDVEGSLADELQRAVWRISLIPLVAGGAIALALVASRPGRVVAIRVGVTAIVATAAAVLVVVIVVTPDTNRVRACNGHAELCDRPYDKVAQAATHNAMSSPDVVQIWPEQDLTIGQQLDLGIRTLLIDVHYWPRTTPADISRVAPSLPNAVAQRIASINADRFRPREGVYLCHLLCAFGGIPFGDGLAQIRSFLERNPDEIVTLIVQDEVAPADVVRALSDAGLAKYAFRPVPAEPWPTLGHLIDRGERLVVFAENSGPPPAWYQAAFDEIAETPFGFPNPDAMTCVPNRGPRAGPLFLMNHWISSAAPDRAAALQVNQPDAIVERARRCARERALSPNFVAVDFAGLGGVVQAVDVLNSVNH